MSMMAEAARPVEVSVQDWARLSAAQRLAAGELLAVRPAGVAPGRWLAMSEAGRRAALLRSGAVPEGCGPEIPVAPARGALRAGTLHLVEAAGDAEAPRATLIRGYQARGEAGPRKAASVIDVFDRMEAAALRARKPLGLSALQIATGRQYRTLVERQAAGAVKLSSLEGRTGGSGRGLDVTDLRLAEARQLAAMRGRIGDGAALAVRRVRPSARGGVAASIIRDRVLVDMVCLEDMDLSAVLEAHGWSVRTGSLDTLRTALAASLDRMGTYLGEWVKKGA
jgi:hypothetical protein